MLLVLWSTFLNPQMGLNPQPHILDLGHFCDPSKLYEKHFSSYIYATFASEKYGVFRVAVHNKVKVAFLIFKHESIILILRKNKFLNCNDGLRTKS